jgi:hypothetical protein
VNPDAKDWLDAALRSREAATAPPAFTQKVMRRVAVEERPSVFLTLFAENALPLGLGLAAGGLFSLVDLALLQVPIVASAVIGVACFVTSQTLDASES